jgi:hypothetical protein
MKVRSAEWKARRQDVRSVKKRPRGTIILSGRSAPSGAGSWTSASGLPKDTASPEKRKRYRERTAKKKIIKRGLDNFLKIYYNKLSNFKIKERNPEQSESRVTLFKVPVILSEEIRVVLRMWT